MIMFENTHTQKCAPGNALQTSAVTLAGSTQQVLSTASVCSGISPQKSLLFSWFSVWRLALMSCPPFYYKTKHFEWSRQGICEVLLLRNSVCTTTQIFVSRYTKREGASSHLWFMSISVNLQALWPLSYQLNTLCYLYYNCPEIQLASNCRWALATPNHRKRKIKPLCRPFSSLKAWFKYSCF